MAFPVFGGNGANVINNAGMGWEREYEPVIPLNHKMVDWIVLLEFLQRRCLVQVLSHVRLTEIGALGMMDHALLRAEKVL